MVRNVLLRKARVFSFNESRVAAWIFSRRAKENVVVAPSRGVMIWIGTSGFQYPEWKGKFYPAKTSAAAMLPFYAERFPTTEINYERVVLPAPRRLT